MRLAFPPRLVALAAGLFLAAVSLSAAVHPDHGHSSEASRPRVDVLEDGKVVVSLDLKGDLPGTVTFNFEPNADGTLTGHWAAQIAYADPTDPETGEEPPHEHGSTEAHEHGSGEQHGETPHKDFLRLVHRGAMSGPIGTATLTFDNGVLTAMTVALTVEQGTLEFTGAAGSNGSASLTRFTLAF